MFEAIAYRGRARLIVSQGQSDGAEAEFKRAVAKFKEVGAPYWVAASLVDFGEWLTAQERSMEAELLLSEAVGVFESLGAHAWVDRLRAHPIILAAPSTEAARS